MNIDMIHRIKRRWMKLRLQPIRIFCLHHVSDVYDPTYMWEEDWINTDVLKQKILQMQQDGTIFISLNEAYEKLVHDSVRCKKYAVLTADDGFRTMLTILPWLKEKQIPITLFINPKYITDDVIGDNLQRRIRESGVEKSSNEIYLKKEDLIKIQSSLVSFGYHGYEHRDERKMSIEDFKENIELCLSSMSDGALNMSPFYAHTYGHSFYEYDEMLRRYGLTPVYVSGHANYNKTYYLDRELLIDKSECK